MFLNHKSKKTLIIYIQILAIVASIGILCSLLFIFKYKFSGLFSSGEAVYSPSDITKLKESSADDLLANIASRLSSGESAYSVLKEYYPDKIVYTDNGHYAFADINTTLKMNHFSKDGFTRSASREITYSENGAVLSHKGIDISKYQGDIDFTKVKAAGVEYAMIRCGYRSYGAGVLTEDSSFYTYAPAALSNDLKVGVYFFTQAINESEAKEEADFVVNMLKPYHITYPVVLDVEEIANDTYRQQNLSKEDLTNVIIAFCDEIKAAGYTPMIYSNLKYFAGKVDISKLESYEKWFAYYDDAPYFPYDISMWQYTESGSIDGIPGNVDMDISFKTWN